MKIILKKKIDELLRKDWIFLEKNNNPLIYQTLIWNESWLNENDKNKEVLIFVAYDNENPVIIFPFCIVQKFNFRILRWIGYDMSDYLGPLISDEYKLKRIDFENIWQEIFNSIKKKCDLILLDKQINKNFF